MLDPKGLEAVATMVADITGCMIDTDDAAEIVTAYLEAATPPDVAGLIDAIEACDWSHVSIGNKAILRQAATALRLSAGGGWRTMDSAPKDGTEVLVYAPPYAGLGDIICKAAWHNDAGWCVDELRTVTHWQSLPAFPTVEDGHDE